MMSFITTVGQVVDSRAHFDQLSVPLLGCSKTTPIMQTFPLRQTTPAILMRTASPRTFHWFLLLELVEHICWNLINYYFFTGFVWLNKFLGFGKRVWSHNSQTTGCLWTLHVQLFSNRYSRHTLVTLKLYSMCSSSRERVLSSAETQWNPVEFTSQARKSPADRVIPWCVICEECTRPWAPKVCQWPWHTLKVTPGTRRKTPQTKHCLSRRLQLLLFDQIPKFFIQ